MTDNPYAAPTAQPGPHPTAKSARRRWFRAPFRLLIIHTALILTFMSALLAGWSDFGPIPFDCVYPPYLFISGPIVHVAAHAVQHAFDPLLSPDDVASVRLAWNLIPGSVCLVLGGFQWWRVEVVYLRIRRRPRTISTSLHITRTCNSA